jgi:hypothetical protein
VIARLTLLIPPLRGRAPDVGVSALAAGADQLFARYMLDVGAALIAIVPCREYEDTFTTARDLRSYRLLLSRAAEVERLPYAVPSEEAFMAAGRRVVDQCDWLVAVWDGAVSRGLGGTADVVAYAQQLGKRVEVLWPAGVRR